MSGEVVWHGALWRQTVPVTPPPAPNHRGPGKVDAAVLACLAQRAMTTRELSERTGWTGCPIRAALQRFERDGTVIAVDLPGQGRTGVRPKLYRLRRTAAGTR